MNIQINVENLKGLYDTLTQIHSNDYVVTQLEKIVETEENDTEDNQIQLETHKALLDYYKSL